MSFGWEGKLTRLVPLDLGIHFENAYRWMNDPEVTQFLLAGDLPITRLQEEEYFRTAATDTNIPFAIETLAGEHIGFSGLHRIDWRNGHAITGTVLGAKEHWGKGLGTDAAMTRTEYARKVLGLRILTSDVFASNERSLRMLEKSGYERTGVIPKRYFKRGEFHDAVMMVNLFER
ncbi:MAG: GNAT family protein [Fimbriimonadales bacterium]